MKNTILRLPAVILRTSISRSNIYHKISKGEFPKQISLGSKRSVGWVESEIDEWIIQQIEDSRKTEL